MKPHTIIWDFDGTLYPLSPLDCEQTLLRMRRLEMHEGLQWFSGLWIEGLIYLDRRQWFRNRPSRKLYRRLYNRGLRGTSAAALDRVAEATAVLISADDRKTLRAMHGSGLRMLVISCGTQELCELVLEKADVRDCFETVRANLFKMEAGCIVGGGAAQLVSAEDKLSLAKDLLGRCPEGVVAVGDGYTDLPLLDWVHWPVMMDCDHSRKRKYASKSYHFIPAITALPRLLAQLQRSS